MEKRFAHIKKKQVTETTETLMTLEEVREVLFTEQPKEIWCPEWSNKRPFIEVSEYLPETDEIKCKCGADGTKTGEVLKVQQFYNRHRYGGLRSFEF